MQKGLEMDDSLGRVPLRESSTSLLQNDKPLSKTRRTFEKSDAIALIARLALQYGQWKVGEEGSDELLAREYVTQFYGQDPAIVNEAATAFIGSSTVWRGEIAFILKWINDKRAAVSGPPGRRQWKSEPHTERTPEELARVTEMVSKFLGRGKYAAPKAEPKTEEELPPLDRPYTEAELDSVKRCAESLRRLTERNT